MCPFRKCSYWKDLKRREPCFWFRFMKPSWMLWSGLEHGGRSAGEPLVKRKDAGWGYGSAGAGDGDKGVGGGREGSRMLPRLWTVH